MNTTALICDFVQHATVEEIRRVYTALYDLAAKEADSTRAARAHVYAADADADADVDATLASEREHCAAFMTSQLVREDMMTVWKFWNTPAIFAAENPGLLGTVWQLLYFSDLAQKAVF
jgi:hypothetical protein